ncbi:MAG: hypothetical protein KME57_32860 [Scytonema hyalinum WJT4-NPBG1]|nr:hypothetical protein [Scytonema hyalinum WJT4-NPBG1]
MVTNKECGVLGAVISISSLSSPQHENPTPSPSPSGYAFGTLRVCLRHEERLRQSPTAGNPNGRASCLLSGNPPSALVSPPAALDSPQARRGAAGGLGF